MSGPLYEIRDLSFSYRLDGQAVEALSGVTCEIPHGAMLCLTGPSGSGKSTLLNILGLIEPVQKGEVRLDGKSFQSLNEYARNELRRARIGFVFQQFHLFPVLSAEENVEFFLVRAGIPAPERKERVRQALESVGLYEHRQKRPLAMSGGQRQRVAIARALAKRPEVIIADEPTASLDQKTGREILAILQELNSRQGVTVICSSHDPMVLSFAKSRIHLSDGKIAPEGGNAA
jgi:ABC-type lipoprotein export system ATPase subunit